MSIQAVAAVLRLQNVTPAEKLLLLALANYADEDMRCWPSQATLARDTGYSTRTMVTLYKQLEVRGILSRERRERRRDGTRRSAVTYLRLHSEAASHGWPSQVKLTAPDIVKQLHPHSEAASPKPSIEPSEEEPSARAREPQEGRALTVEEERAWVADEFKKLAKRMKGSLQ